MSALAILGAVMRGNNSQAFRGGNLVAIMGGCEIDLRNAAIDGEAVIDVFAMWGGIELRVPADWTVSSQIVPLMGGVEDKTRPPRGAAVAPADAARCRVHGRHRDQELTIADCRLPIAIAIADC